MPQLSSVSEKNGIMHFGGVSVPDLARQYGTPLYIIDEDYIRNACRDFSQTLKKEYMGKSLVAFASKALCFKALYQILNEEGMGTDVVSGGELYTALSAGFPPDRIFFHGNNKTNEEIDYALKSGIRRIVIDNREELAAVSQAAAKLGITADISFRVKPGIDAHTHDFVKTGKIDSKFGVALETGEAFDIIQEAKDSAGVRVKGLHCHIGSQIFDLEPFKLAVRVMMEFMADLNLKLGCDISELNLGGGYGIRYIESHDPPELRTVASEISKTVTSCASDLGLGLPDLVLEPGRSIAAPAGITVYTVGSVKEIPGICNYVSVDGGMTDNPRHALYGAIYDAVLPERMCDRSDTVVTIAGRCCESGDIVSKNVSIPRAKAGDFLAVLSTGAYNYSMASNYNRLPRPPIVMVRGGQHRVVVRRETYEDLIRLDQ